MNKQTIYYIGFVLLILIAPLYTSAQHEQLKTMLEGKETFQEISETFEQYLEIAPESYEKERLQKHYSRWAYYQSMHLGPDGDFVNVGKKTLEAIEKLPPSENSESANGAWYFVGPNASTITNPDADIDGLGRADRMAFHPTNANIIYVGTPSGGLWKTTNGGSSWTCISNFIPSLGISGIVLDHSNTNRLYVLTGDGDSYISGGFVNSSGYLRLSAGVLVSHDGGTTWEQTGQLSTSDFVGYRLIQHPTNANILLAATSDGIYRTTNGGDTWVQERTGKHFDIEFKPGYPSRVYASAPGAFVYSTNTGDTWNTDANFDYSLKYGQRVEIAVTANSESRVYLVCGPGYNDNTFGGFWRSANSGSDFTRLCTSPNILGKGDGTGDQSYYDMGIAVDPDNANNVAVGGLVMYRSTNGGSSFTQATNFRGAGPPAAYIHPDIHGVEYNNFNGYLYAAGDGGFHRSTDNGVTWTDLYNGINTTQFYHFDDYDANKYVMLGGCQDNGVKYRSTNTYTYNHIYCCDGGECAINYSNSSRGFAVVNNYIGYFSNFNTNSPSWIAGGTGYNFFPQVEMHVSNPDIIYYSYSSIKEYEVGAGTSSIGDPATRGHWVIRTCPSYSSRFYCAGGSSFAATTGDMWVFLYSGGTWTEEEISDNTGFPGTYPRISDIGVYPSYSQQVYVTFSGYTDNCKVYYSSDAGTSWTNVSYDLPNIPIWSIIVDGSNNAYIGTDIGVFFKPAGVNHWEPFNNGMPNVPVSDLEINETEDQVLAATFGRGFWKSTLRDACPSATTISINLSGYYFRSASTSITTTSNVVGGEGTDVTLRAGSYVDMNPGFYADGTDGNLFQAYIGACNSGMPDNLEGTFPIYPDALLEYPITMSRYSGTLEILGDGNNSRDLIIRQFQDGKVRVILADVYGKYLRDVANFKGNSNEITEVIDISDLNTGLYYLYLVVNDEVVHLQELDLLEM